MTYREDFTLPAELLERVSKQGFDILPELIQVIINAAMQAERQQYLKVEPYQHTEERQGHANGYKPKTVHTRVGSITFSIPQVREGGFYPEALEKGLRSERGRLHQHGDDETRRADGAQGGVLPACRHKQGHQVGREDRADRRVADIQAEPEQVDGDVIVPVQAFHGVPPLVYPLQKPKVFETFRVCYSPMILTSTRLRRRPSNSP